MTATKPTGFVVGPVAGRPNFYTVKPQLGEADLVGNSIKAEEFSAGAVVYIVQCGNLGKGAEYGFWTTGEATKGAQEIGSALRDALAKDSPANAAMYYLLFNAGKVRNHFRPAILKAKSGYTFTVVEKWNYKMLSYPLVSGLDPDHFMIDDQVLVFQAEKASLGTVVGWWQDGPTIFLPPYFVAIPRLYRGTPVSMGVVREGKDPMVLSGLPPGLSSANGRTVDGTPTSFGAFPVNVKDDLDREDDTIFEIGAPPKIKYTPAIIRQYKDAEILTLMPSFDEIGYPADVIKYWADFNVDLVNPVTGEITIPHWDLGYTIPPVSAENSWNLRGEEFQVEVILKFLSYREVLPGLGGYFNLLGSEEGLVKARMYSASPAGRPVKMLLDHWLEHTMTDTGDGLWFEYYVGDLFPPDAPLPGINPHLVEFYYFADLNWVLFSPGASLLYFGEINPEW